jgi:hypothetical protein
VRTAVELFGQMFSMALENRLRHAEGDQDRHARDSATRLIAAIAGNNELLGHASWLQDQLHLLIPCDGLCVSLGGHRSSSGLTPASADVEMIARVMAFAPAGPIVASDNLKALLPPPCESITPIAGALCIPLSRPGDYVLLFRKEWIHEIQWSGEPRKIEVHGDDIPRLSPRKSFAAFKESIRGRSQAFTQSDRRRAEELRMSLSEVIVRGSHHADIDRKRVSERQEILIAELNHRVRNVLALIRGLITQTQGEDGDATSYVKSLSGRVQALARAHDRVTRQHWGPGPLNLERALHEVARIGRPRPAGPHQARFRFCNFGAGGSIRSARNGTDALLSDGCRGGFLHSRASHCTGAHPGTRSARNLGCGHINGCCRHPGSAAAEWSRCAAARGQFNRGDGGRGNVACARRCFNSYTSTVATAARVTESVKLDFAVLDVNLGFETSLDFATQLRGKDIPFIFTSGYGDNIEIEGVNRAVMTVSKPYDRDQLRLAIIRTLASHSTPDTTPI